MSRKNKTPSSPPSSSPPPSNSFPWKEFFTFLGVVIAAYIGYLGMRFQVEIPIKATQTAEARQTAAAQILAFNPSDNINTPEEINILQSTETPIYTEVAQTNGLQDSTPTATNEEILYSNVTETPNNYTDPVKFIYDYFSLINEQRYEDGWTKLSFKFKENFSARTNGGGYNEYIEYWKTVENVEISTIEIKSQNDSTAIVYAEILFTYITKNTEIGHITYKLVKNSTGESWLFDPN